MTPDHAGAKVLIAAAREIGPLRGEPTLVVLHSIEGPETAKAAENTASFFAHGSGGRAASAHYVCDADSIVQCVPEANQSWGAIGVNKWAVHIEQAGRAGQSSAQWDDPYSHSLIYGRVVPLIASICRRNNIPTVALDAAALIRSARAKTAPRGITTHAAVSAASKAIGLKSSGHWDPGPHYPLAAVVAAVDALVS